ncbi:MAG: CopG family transcriptional regulator [Actinomycetota bacterium]
MRMHIELDDELVTRIDAIAGDRGRSRFIRRAIMRALDHANRWDLIESAYGSIAERGHDWDNDPAAWVRQQRRADRRRIG